MDIGNPHPPLSSFPFVILSLLLLIEVYSLFAKNKSSIRPVSIFLVTILAIISPLTYYSGFWGLEFAEQSFTIPDAKIDQHQMYARLYLITLVPTSLFYSLKTSNENSKILCYLYRLSLLLSLALVGYVSFLGGSLVFNHGAGVKLL